MSESANPGLCHSLYFANHTNDSTTKFLNSSDMRRISQKNLELAHKITATFIFDRPKRSKVSGVWFSTGWQIMAMSVDTSTRHSELCLLLFSQQTLQPVERDNCGASASITEVEQLPLLWRTYNYTTIQPCDKNMHTRVFSRRTFSVINARIELKGSQCCNFQQLTFLSPSANLLPSLIPFNSHLHPHYYERITQHSKNKKSENNQKKSKKKTHSRAVKTA